MGTNLGNWLESGRIHVQVQQDQFRLFSSMKCSASWWDRTSTADFWKAFKDNYVTREDIRFIKEQGQHHPPAFPLQAVYRRGLYGSTD